MIIPIDRWNVRARMHFIICVPVENRSWLKPFVRSVWRKKILNFAVSYFYEIFETVDYNPFFDKINNLTSNLGRAFGNKLKNMNGYPLRVGFFADRPRIEQINGEFYGADVSLMRRFVERLNATLQIKQPIEQLLTEDKFLVNLNAVVQEAVDCTFISYFGISKMTTVSSTYPRRMDDIVVLVPYAAVVPQYLYVFMMFPEEVWISIVFSLTAVILCAFICLRYTNRRVGITKLALEHWGAILNVSIKFTNRHVLARYLFLLWSYSCLTLNALFQSLLMTNLITPKYQKNFDTLRDLANSNVRIITHPFHAEMAEGLYPKHLLIERPQYKVLQRIVEGDTSAAYAVQTSIAELLTSRTTAGEHHTYHVLEEHLIPGYNVYLFQKHSPYLDEANDYILLDQQFGLSKFNQNRNCTRKAKKKTRNIAVLSLSHLQSAFYIFFVGIFVSSLALILEVVFHRTKARMN